MGFFDTPHTASAPTVRFANPIPEGDYALVVSKIERASFSWGEGLYITFTVCDGEFERTNIRRLLCVEHKTPSTAQRAIEDLDTMLTLANVQQFNSVDELVGISFVGRVVLKPRSDTGALQNEVQFYGMGAAPKAATTPKPAQLPSGTAKAPTASATATEAPKPSWGRK